MIGVLDWQSDTCRIRLNGEHMSHLRFADDIVTISSNLSELETMLQELDEASRVTGLKMNMKKTKVMTEIDRIRNSPKDSESKRG